MEPKPGALYGPETRKALANFDISGEPMPLPVVHWLALIKGAAAVTNARLGLLDPQLGAQIAAAAGRIANSEYDDQFPIDVFQTGSGTSTNMNVNEVIAALVPGAHPNDHVNLGQSSNDTVPSAVHLAALDLTVHELIPALDQLAESLQSKADAFAEVVKAGRTHLMDAVPVFLGAEFGGYAAQMRLGIERLEACLGRVGQLPLGGTATGTGLNTHPDLAAGVRELLSVDLGIVVSAPKDPFEAQANRDALVELSGASRTIAVSLTKIAQDLVLMSSGPRTGFAEIALPELQKGSSIMPGKVNPVIPEVVLQVCAQVIGNDTAVTVAGMQGQLELNARVPVMARNLLSSLQLLTRTAKAFASKCIDGIAVNEAGVRASADATLAAATALNPLLGYDAVATIVQKAAATGQPLREVALHHGVSAADYDRHVDLPTIARGVRPDPSDGHEQAHPHG